jgi:acyl-CoA synthetase (AMP-forming)/AMP-acid ligase II
MTLRTDMGSLLEEQANSRGDRPFIKMAGDAHWMTYGAFNERANRLAHGVRGLGVGKGDYVCIILENSIDYLAFSYALKKIAAIEVSINTEFRGVGLTRLINLTGARLVINRSGIRRCDRRYRNNPRPCRTFGFCR